MHITVTSSETGYSRLVLFQPWGTEDQRLSTDYEDLQYYLTQYNRAVFDQNAAASNSEITCNGSEFFKNDCEQAKQRHAQAIKDQETYTAQINKLIARRS